MKPSTRVIRESSAGLTSGLEKNGPLFLLLGIILILNVLSVQRVSITGDEYYHYLYGERWLFNSSQVAATDDSKMPFGFLNTIPGNVYLFAKYFFTAKVSLSKLARISQNFIADPQRVVTKMKLLPEHYGVDIYTRIRLGRYVTMLFSVFLGFIVYQWSKELYGAHAGILSLFLYVFCPNILAHSQLVTTDMFATSMIATAIYLFWKFLKNGGWVQCFLSAVILGFAQLAKYSSVYLYPIFLLIVTVRFIKYYPKLNGKDTLSYLIKNLLTLIKYVFVFIAASVVVINLGYRFNGSFTPMNHYKFESKIFLNLQSAFPAALSSLPVPLPSPYLKGLDTVKSHEETAASFGNIYLLGKLKEGDDPKGFMGYFFTACFFKMPIATQLLIMLSFYWYLRRWRRNRFYEDEIFLLLPLLFFSIYFNYFYRAQIGIRFFLVVFPLLFVFCGNFFRNFPSLNSKMKGAIIALLVYLVVSNMSYFPHYLAYFNELLTDRKNAYKILADSNIDWHQSEWYLEKFLEKNPDAIVKPQTPVCGKIIININELVGVFDPKQYQWLRENHKPSEHIGYAYLVYNVPCSLGNNAIRS